ncbi:putative 2-phosphosulfolactate phosphatase [Caldalkalibacillus thermarum]|uniref:2-phosphosulfolactate phosphatase n=1 Tax=Caldalkalibacillus thermarum TaxID=296745 RepID=UPI00166D8851|nr:2-phosphosulfolactate phosphatase [Caldalkalibacillus thermarum]GGK30609.1 putative 2-phosphosulfolactate phosphatase [Caldalkalibacillus thermarum]
MGKIHLLMRKEELIEEKLQDKVVVVLDILLATTTIVTVLEHGAKEVIPVLDEKEARQRAKRYSAGEPLLAGEYQGKTIDGFLDPGPTFLKEKVKGKTVILSTTNGTVAIRKSAGAEKVYIGALLNGERVAQKIVSDHHDKTILIVCSGSGGAFNLEDFYGAGYLSHCLVRHQHQPWELTDAAQAALLFYQSRKGQGESVLKCSRVGQMLMRQGFGHEVLYALKRDAAQVVPYLTEQGAIRGCFEPVKERR